MDEPTNNLDDSSVEIFINTIENLSKERTFIIVSHDPRLVFKDFQKIIINGGVIEDKVFFNNSEINRKIGKSNKTNFFKMSSGINKNKINYLVFFLSLFVVLFISLYVHIQLTYNYSTDTIPPKNVIYTYKGDYALGELNQVYIKGAGLKIDPNNNYRMIRYSDIPDISKIEGVSKIIASDYSFLDEVDINFTGNKLLDKLNVISIPDYLTKDVDILDFSFGIRNIKSGRLPLDGKNEITISTEQLKKFYNYTNEMISNSIGNSIKYYNEDYTIVGLSYNDIAFISYDSKNNLDSDYLNEVNELIIYTGKGKEKSVLDELFRLYPAENYFSSEYVKIWTKEFNSDVINKIFRTSILFSIIISLSLFYISKNQLNINITRILDYENYYIDKKKIKRIYLISSLFQYISILIISMIIISFSSFSFIINNIILVNIVILFIPAFVYSTWRLRNA